MIILTYVYLQLIPAMRGKNFEKQSNLACDMDVNILGKMEETKESVCQYPRYLVRTACVQKLECS